jgi:glyceraldehyde 3-phosphate dehydrogenase
MLRVGINGFGRIGRQVLKAMLECYRDSLEVVAVNDLSPAETNAHLFRYDSNYGRFPGEVKVGKDSLFIDGLKIKNFALRDPSQIPWADVGADLVIESTGLFLSKEKASAHFNGGAKKVIISAPAKDEDITIVMASTTRTTTRKNMT